MKNAFQKTQTKGNNPSRNSNIEFPPKEFIQNSGDQGNKILQRKFLRASIGVMILTVLHHVYGSIIYEAPFRLHVAFIAFPVIAVLLFTFKIFHRFPQKRLGLYSFWSFLIVAIVFPIGIIGLYEGGYNHFLKNVLFISGTSRDILYQLFPPPTYEMPNDILFEISGIFQFFTSLYAGYYLILVLKRKGRRYLGNGVCG